MVTNVAGSYVCVYPNELHPLPFSGEHLWPLGVPPFRFGVAGLGGRIPKSPTSSCSLSQSYPSAPPQEVLLLQSPMEERNGCEARGPTTGAPPISGTEARCTAWPNPGHGVLSLWVPRQRNTGKHSHPYIRSPTLTHTLLETVTHLLTYSHGLPVGRLLHMFTPEKNPYSCIHMSALCLDVLKLSLCLWPWKLEIKTRQSL